MPEKKRKSAVARKIRRRNTSLAVITIVLLLVIVLFTPLFDITDISVTGNKVLSNIEVINASGIKKGTNLFRMNTRECEKNISRLGYADKVKVRRKFLARVEIEITESEEAAFVAFSGNYVGLSIEGKVLSITKSSDMRPKKAVISGYAVKKASKGKIIEGKSESKTLLVRELLTVLSENSMLTSVKKIDISDTQNIRFILNSDTVINMGDTSQLDYKAKCITAVRKELGEIRGGKINASDPSNVIYEGGS